MRIGEAAIGGASGALQSRAPAFQQELARAGCEAAAGGAASHEASGPGPASGARLRCEAAAQVDAVSAAGGTEPSRALSAVERVAQAQLRLDEVLRTASEGKGLSAGALLALQADVYRSSQLLELAGKVVERATSGVKQVLTTQL